MTITSKHQLEATLRKTVQVNALQAQAFDVFTEHFGDWWPLNTHHIGTKPPQTAIMEPRAGGRWFERASDGSECDWGRILVWDPPHRIVLSWDISADWKYDPELGTEVEIRFIAESPDRTRVELEHRKLDRYGAKTDTMRATFDSESGWAGILQRFAQAAAKAGQ